MQDLNYLLENNKAWATAITQQDPDFFEMLSRQQAPTYLWIGCADSRVPATQLVGLAPGEMFVHRNVANLVIHTDLNCLSVIQYAVEVLRVEHIIVCGHYGCGGVRAALENLQLGLIDNWLRQIQYVGQKHQASLAELTSEAQQIDRLCELNVIEQVVNVSRTTIVQNAWQEGQRLAVHGWIYGLGDGLVFDLNIHMTNQKEMPEVYRKAIARLREK